MPIDFSNYSLAELYECQTWVNEKENPENAKNIRHSISLKESEYTLMPPGARPSISRNFENKDAIVPVIKSGNYQYFLIFRKIQIWIPEI